MRREPEQKTVREKPREGKEMPHAEAMKHRMEGYREGVRHGHMDAMKARPANPGDPEKKKGDGMKEAMGTKKDGGTERGKPERPKDPQKVKGDGMKVAMAGEAGKASKLSPMAAAEKRVR